MAGDTEAIEQIEFLARSEPRVRAMEFLREADAATQHECRERLDASRSTVARTLSGLEERGWIEQSGRTYRLTPAGAIVADAFLDLVDTLEATEELSTFLRWFPHDEFDLDLADLRTASVTTSTQSDPYAPANRQTQLMRESDCFRGMLPAIEIEGCRMMHRRCLEDDLDAETIVSPSVAETITEGEYARLFREMVASGAHTVLVADSELPLYLGLTDETEAHVGVDDEEGFPRALLVSDAESVREWAESVYADWRDRATPTSVADFDA